MKKQTDEKISEHFSKLGKKSWEARKAKILGVKIDKQKKVSSDT